MCGTQVAAAPVESTNCIFIDVRKRLFLDTLQDDTCFPTGPKSDFLTYAA
jgi:hypothetical protein